MKKGNETELVIITGMSGAGKTVAMQSFEDLGYYCIDNLPPALIPKFLQLIRDSKNNIYKIALVIDLRGREFFSFFLEALNTLDQETGLTESIIFLDAEDETLVSRYKETRRTHPLAVDDSPLIGIEKERKLLSDFKGRAQIIIDTTSLLPRELRQKIYSIYNKKKASTFSLHFVSFGFKYGLPIDSDLVFDVRFLPNPYYIPEMKKLTGKNKNVRDYVFRWHDTKQFIEKMSNLLNFMLPLYEKEGKSQLVVAIGCTGGQHRSVALVEHFYKEYKDSFQTHIKHRDIEKRKRYL